MDDIVNKVAKSSLVTVDLEDFYPKGKRVLLDIKPWLFEGIVLREKEFRAHLEAHDWASHNGHLIALSCSTDAIIPSWAYLLISTKLSPFAHKVVVGNLSLLESILYQEVIQNLELTPFVGKPVIIKGCTNKEIPSSAYTLLVQKLQPVVSSLFYGEACSTVPLYKNKRKR